MFLEIGIGVGLEGVQVDVVVVGFQYLVVYVGDVDGFVGDGYIEWFGMVFVYQGQYYFVVGCVVQGFGGFDCVDWFVVDGDDQIVSQDVCMCGWGVVDW